MLKQIKISKNENYNISKSYISEIKRECHKIKYAYIRNICFDNVYQNDPCCVC